MRFLVCKCQMVFDSGLKFLMPLNVGSAALSVVWLRLNRSDPSLNTPEHFTESFFVLGRHIGTSFCFCNCRKEPFGHVGSCFLCNLLLNVCQAVFPVSILAHRINLHWGEMAKDSWLLGGGQ